MHLFPDSTDHITTSTNSHPIDRDINISDGNSKYYWTNKTIKLMLIFTLLGHKRIFPNFQGRYIQQNILPENPLPTLMEMGLMIV